MNKFINNNVDELKTKIDELKSRLIEVIDKWYYYQNDVYQDIMFKYDNIFGDLEEEIDSKIQTASELEKKVELMKMKVRTGSSISHNTVRLINAMANRQSCRISFVNSKQNISSNNCKNEPIVKKEPLNCEVNDKYELPQLYRNLVKKLHPDVAGNKQEYVRFWDNVQQAYRSKDLDSLRLLNLTLSADIDDNAPDNRNAEIALRTKIYELEQCIRKQESRLRNLQFQEPFSFAQKLNDHLWVSRRKNQLKSKLIQIDRKIQHHNKLLSSLCSDKASVDSNNFSGSHAV